MVQIVLIGIAAGAASALLFASVASGSLVSVLLFYLAPLPILIAALGWSHLAGLVAAIIAGGTLAFVFGALFFLSFVIGIGLPAWWLGYLALLARPGAAPGPEHVEWYPVGGLVIWAAILGALIITLVILNFGFDADSFRAGLGRAFEQILRIQTDTPADAPLKIPNLTDPSRLIEVMVAIIPPAAAVLATVTNLINLWLAGRIVKISGRLLRPWPDLAAMTFPSFAPPLLAIAVGLTFLPGIVGILAMVLAASLLIAYGALGFAVLHKITGGMNARPFMLAGSYAAVVVFGWPVLLMTVLGLADTALDIRARVARRRPPVKPQT
jgi:Predicted membrane protein (DUF2232)